MLPVFAVAASLRFDRRGVAGTRSMPGVQSVPIIGKHSPDIHIWMIGGNSYGLVKSISDYETVPKNAPAPAVTAMASAPQNVTRIAPAATGAPPARAANPPSSARNTSDVPATRGIRAVSGAMAVTRRGKAAPIAKLPAEASVA
jgi:hypothetical protein